MTTDDDRVRALMSEEATMRPFGSIRCEQYQTKAEFFIKDGGGFRHLISQIRERREAEFLAGIPNNWTDEDIRELVTVPMNSDDPYPAWEMPARVYGSPVLLRWWKGRKEQVS